MFIGNTVIKKWEAAVAVGIVLTIMLSFLSFGAECSKIRSDVLRLHILANSDSEEDQALKIKVRDRILSDTAYLFADTDDITAAINTAKENLEKIQTSAENEIKSLGYDYPVKVEVAKSWFNTRTYDNVTLPAGEYEALRVLIGNAQGHNWWCVMYPGLCVPAAKADNYDTALDGAEQDVVENYQKYEVKFKSVEIFEQIASALK